MNNIQSYLDLTTSQYRNSSKFKKWLTVLLTPLVDSQNLAENLYTYFDIDTAVGHQLDMLGELIGVSRLLPFQPESGSATLEDDDYRFLLKAQILRNVWDGTTQNIYEIWTVLSDTAISVIDNQDMTCTILFIGNLSDIQKEMIKYDMIVPRAQGVYMDYSFSVPPVFAYDQETALFRGYDEGSWLEY